MIKNLRLALGLDIGTTTVSAAIADLDGKRLVESFNIAGGRFVDTTVPNAKEQDPNEKIEKIYKLGFECVVHAWRGFVQKRRSANS